MSRTLPFYDHLMSLGRHLQRLGLHQEAARLFQRLAGHATLPDDYREEAHYRLAERSLDLGKFRRARRHLAAALALCPDNAQYHHLLGIAAAEDVDCDPARALEYFRRAARLDPDNPAYLCDLARQALRSGARDEALTALHRAAELAPDDPDVIAEVANGLRAADCPADAKTLLRAALFRNPRAQRFRDLWNRHQFDMLHAEQQQERTRWKTTDSAVLLPFAPRQRTTVREDGDDVRHDSPSTLPGPHRVKVRKAARKSNP